MAVPDGTVQDVLDWVGNDPDRAEDALTAEEAGQNRSTLIAKLEAIASEPREDTAVTETETAPEQPVGANEPVPNAGIDYEDLAPGPEQPVEVIIDPRAEGTVVGPIHVRDGEVEVPEDADLTPAPDTDPDAEDAEPRGLGAQQVEFFQAVSATNGVVLSLNGTAFVFSPQLVATLKGALDKAVAGLSL
jgi:hypothetical protein